MRKRITIGIIAIGIAIITIASLIADGNVNVINPASRPVPVTSMGAVPSNVNQKGASSGNVANATATASLAAVSGRTNYLEGFTVTAGGATAALDVNVTVTGLVTGTFNYSFVFPLGAGVGAVPLVVNFDPPIKASAANTAITVTLPAGGAGNTNAAVNINGFDL